VFIPHLAANGGSPSHDINQSMHVACDCRAYACAAEVQSAATCRSNKINGRARPNVPGYGEGAQMRATWRRLHELNMDVMLYLGPRGIGGIPGGTLCPALRQSILLRRRAKQVLVSRRARARPANLCNHACAAMLGSEPTNVGSHVRTKGI
jgi:hypothetical protein